MTRKVLFSALFSIIAIICIGCPVTPSLTYTIIYDGNGNTSGEVPLDYGNYSEGESATVLGNSGELLKTGYSFSGWNTEPDGSGTDYEVGSELIMPASDITLYAI